MPNDYQYREFVKLYPHLQRKDLSYEERMKLYYETKENAMCGCGRSPREDGKCVGFHKLSEEVWEDTKSALIESYKRLQEETKE